MISGVVRHFGFLWIATKHRNKQEETNACSFSQRRPHYTVNQSRLLFIEGEHAHSLLSSTPFNPIIPSPPPWSPCCFELMSNIDVCPYPAALVPPLWMRIIHFWHRNCWTTKQPITTCSAKDSHY